MGVCSCRRPIRVLGTSLGLQRHTLSLARNSHARKALCPRQRSQLRGYLCRPLRLHAAAAAFSATAHSEFRWNCVFPAAAPPPVLPICLLNGILVACVSRKTLSRCQDTLRREGK